MDVEVSTINNASHVESHVEDKEHGVNKTLVERSGFPKKKEETMIRVVLEVADTPIVVRQDFPSREQDLEQGKLSTEAIAGEDTLKDALLANPRYHHQHADYEWGCHIFHCPKYHHRNLKLRLCLQEVLGLSSSKVCLLLAQRQTQLARTFLPI